MHFTNTGCILPRLRHCSAIIGCILLVLLGFIAGTYQPTQSPPTTNVQLSPPDLPTMQPIIELSSLTSEPLIGREKDKQVVLSWLEFQTSTVQIVSIVGGPGVGKSALALDVGHTMVGQEAKVYYADMYNSSNSLQPLISKALAKWMENMWHPTLLILDNCDNRIHKQKEEFQNLLQSLKILQYIKVLTTSQRGDILAFPGLGFEEYHLQKLEKYEAMSLLQRNTEGLNSSTADYICDLVDNNPLALITIAAHLKSKSVCNLWCIIKRLEKDPIDLFSSFTELSKKYSVVSSIRLAYEYLEPKYQKCGWQLAMIHGPVDEAALAVHMKPKFNDSAECLEIFTKRSLLEYSEFMLVKHGAKLSVSQQVHLQVTCESSDSKTTIYKLPRLIRYYLLRVSENLPEQLLSTAPAPIETYFKYLWLPKCAPNWPHLHEVVPTSYADEMLSATFPRPADQNLQVVVEIGVKAFYWGMSNHFYETDLKLALSSLKLLDDAIDPKGTDQIPAGMPESNKVLAAYVYFIRKSLGIKWSAQTQCPNSSEAVSIMLKKKSQVEVLHCKAGKNDLALSAYREFYIDFCSCCWAAPRSTPGCESRKVLECLLKGIVDQAVETSYLFQRVPPSAGSPAVVTSNTLLRRPWLWYNSNSCPNYHYLTQELHLQRKINKCHDLINNMMAITVLYRMCQPRFIVTNHWSYKLRYYGLARCQSSYSELKCADHAPRDLLYKLYHVQAKHNNFLKSFYRLKNDSEMPKSNSMTQPKNLLSDHCEYAYWVYNTGYEILMPDAVHGSHDQSNGQTNFSHDQLKESYGHGQSTFSDVGIIMHLFLAGLLVFVMYLTCHNHITKLKAFYILLLFGFIYLFIYMYEVRV